MGQRNPILKTAAAKCCKWMSPLLSFLGVSTMAGGLQQWPHELARNRQASSTLFYPVVATAILWGHEWSPKSIYIYSDNLAAFDILNKDCSNSPAIMPFIRRLISQSVMHQSSSHSRSFQRHLRLYFLLLFPEVQALGPALRLPFNTSSTLFCHDVRHVNPAMIPLIIDSQNSIINSTASSTLLSYCLKDFPPVPRPAQHNLHII